MQQLCFPPILRRALAIVMVGFATSIGTAQLPQTRLVAVFPTGAAIGSSQSVTVTGPFTEAASSLVFSHPGITAKSQFEPATDSTVAHRRPRQFDVQVASDVPPGNYELRAFGPTGLSNPVRFTVTRIKNRVADGGNEQQPQAIHGHEIVHAKFRPDQIDHFQIELSQGQSVLVQVRAERIDSQADALLEIFSPDGLRLARSRQSLTRDPIVSLVAPTNGLYRIVVAETTYRGGDDYAYQLEVSDRPVIEAVFPPLARPGTSHRYRLYGFNLPQAEPISDSQLLGHLQTTALTFAPQLNVSMDQVGSSQLAFGQGRIAGAVLPEPAADAPPIPMSLAESGVIIAETEPNDEPEQAQRLAVPCDLGGQFFPRRDVDWFEIAVEAGQTINVSLCSQRLGTPCDALLRVRRKIDEPDGTVRYQELTATDDLEGPPRDRATRRLDASSTDASFRFTGDQASIYQISVQDLYNVQAEDPRQVYHLRIDSGPPRCQLIAFVEPDRQGDIRNLQPLGLGLLPLGTAAVRVRLLPEPGFDQPVDVHAVGLPAGVTASKLVLTPKHREGLIVFEAGEQAITSQSQIQIRGRVRSTDLPEVIARSASITRGANNVDQQPTEARLTSDLLLAVIDSDRQNIRLEPQPITICPGATVLAPLRIIRHQYDGEVPIEATDLPAGFEVANVTGKGPSAELTVKLKSPLPPGQYALPLVGKVSVNRPRNTWRVAEAEGDLRKVDQALASQALAEQAAAKELAAAQKTGSDINAEFSKLQEQRDLQVQSIKSELEAAKRVAEQLVATFSRGQQEAASDATHQEIAELETQLNKHSETRKSLAQQAANLERLIAPVQAKLQSAQATVAAIEKKLAARKAEREATEKLKGERAKALENVRKEELQQKHDFWVYSSPVEVTVQPLPLSIELGEASPNKNEPVAFVPLRITRQFGFAGSVQIDVPDQPALGITASSMTLAASAKSAKLPIMLSQTPTSDVSVPVKFSVDFNDTKLHHDIIVPVRGSSRE